MSAEPPASSRVLFSGRFVALLAMQMAFGFSLSTFLLLPKVLASLGGTALGIGAVTALFGVGSVAVVPFLGAQLDRQGARAPVLLGNLLMAAAAFGFLLVDRVGPLALVLRGVQGVAWTMVFNAGMTLTATLAPPGRLAQAMGVYGSANLITNALAPALAEPLIDLLGYRPVFAGAGALALGGWALGRRLWAPPVVRPEGPVAGLGALLADRRYRNLAIVIGLAGLALGVMFTFHQPFALALGLRNVRGFFIGYTVGALAVRLGAGRVVDRAGHRRTTVAALVLYGLVTAGTSLLGPGRLVLFGALFGVAHGLFLPAVLALAVTGAAPEARGRILAVMNGSLSAGAAFVPALGAVADAFGYPAVFVGTGLLAFCAIAFTPRER